MLSSVLRSKRAVAVNGSLALGPPTGLRNAGLSMILTDDGYRQTQHPQPDDLVFYVNAEYGILHVGRIVELRPGVSVESQRVPWAVSKWSDWAGEVLHNVFDHPYRRTFDVTVQYWTDRPAGK